MDILDEKYWTERYKKQQTEWDTSAITTPLKTYFDQLEDKSLSILVPGCGNAYEAEYLHRIGFDKVFLADISSYPLKAFRGRVPTFPEENLLHVDFFQINGEFDLIVEQTFFCALEPAMRLAYVKKTKQLLRTNGKLVGLLFDDPLNDDRPPFGGKEEDYKKLFAPYFDFKVFDACYNSIKPRAGRELFINLSPKTD